MLFWLVCIAAGLSMTTIAWLILRPMAIIAGSTQLGSNAVKRSLLQRCSYPWIQVLAPVCRRLMSRQLHLRLLRRLEMAGWQDQYKPEELLAMQGLCAALLASTAMVAMLSQGMGYLLVAVLSLLMAGIGVFLPFRHTQVLAQRRQSHMLKEFPFILDIMTLCVEAGANFHVALTQVAAYCPQGMLKQELVRALAQMRAGLPRHQALESMALRTGLPVIKHWVLAVRQTEQMGMSLAPLLRAQATRQRSERFLRAETKAMQAPVKMLFPLVLCIFPCTFLIIVFPVAVQILGGLY